MEDRDPHVAGFKDDGHKPRPSLVFESFARALEQVIAVGTFGAAKYTDDGWKYVENGITRYTDALYRHLIAEAKGEAADKETGRLHAAHAAWNALARLELLLQQEERNS